VMGVLWCMLFFPFPFPALFPFSSFFPLPVLKWVTWSFDHFSRTPRLVTGFYPGRVSVPPSIESFFPLPGFFLSPHTLASYLYSLVLKLPLHPMQSSCAKCPPPFLHITLRGELLTLFQPCGTIRSPPEKPPSHPPSKHFFLLCFPPFFRVTTFLRLIVSALDVLIRTFETLRSTRFFGLFPSF